MRFHVVFVDDIKTQLIANRIERAAVGIVRGANGIDVVALHGQQVAANLILRNGSTAFGAEIVAVRTLEHDALAVEVHDGVLQFEPAEADALANDLQHLAAAVLDREQQVIQIRRFAAPQARGFDRHLNVKLALRHTLRRRNDLAAVKQLHLHAACTSSLIQLHLHRQIERRIRIAVIQQRLDADIRDMRLGDGIQIDVAENAGEAHEVLILQPASRAPTLNAAGELVFAFNEVLSQLKVAGRKGIRREADVVSVQPDGDAALRALEGDKETLADHLFRHKKRLDIAGDGVIFLRNLADLHALEAVPRILHVGILRNAVSLHLDMCRNADIRPAAAVKIRRLKAGNHLTCVQRVMEFPKSIERIAQAGFTTGKLLHVGVSHMIGMCRDPVFFKEHGILEFAHVKVHMLFSFRFKKRG